MNEQEELGLCASRAEELVEKLVGEDAALGLDGEAVAAETVQRLLWAAVKLYTASRVGEDLEAFHRPDVTATEVAITSRAMLRAVQMEVFELGLWHSWGD